MSINQEFILESSQNSNCSVKQVQTVLALLIDEKCTVPFISRYRKEATGNLDEVQIRLIQDEYQKIEEREKRRTYVLDYLEKEKLLTPELKTSLNAAKTQDEIELIYAPFKSKKKTKAQKARDAGLQPFAESLYKEFKDLKILESEFQPTAHVKNFEDACEGAKAIFSEVLSLDLDLRENLQEIINKTALLESKIKKDAKKHPDFNKYKDFHEYEEKLESIRRPTSSHRFLALKRAESEKIISFKVNYDLIKCQKFYEAKYINQTCPKSTEQFLKDSIESALKITICPSIEKKILTDIKGHADIKAIDIFMKNLKQLLLAPYLGAEAVMGIDPGVRTGCKIVIINKTGDLVEDFVIYPHPPQNKITESLALVSKAIDKHEIKYIAIGNGTYGRETLEILAPQLPKGVNATLISESGASIYSASDIAREEFPKHDVTVRGAVSIARRFRDPLAELVKIDPKSIGVGQYQHDVNQTKLKKSLSEVVESCVNYVGVDLNTASPYLLSFISGIGPTLAKNIAEHRAKSGGFKNREELKTVKRFTDKIFEQAAGFLRIYNGKNPLDGTFIHPEQYSTLENWQKNKNIEITTLLSDQKALSTFKTDEKLKGEIGEHTFNDIIGSLEAPSQDPRTVFTTTEFDSSIKSLKDLKVNSWYTGVISNITQFGAFVDLGIKENGLVHVSQLADKFVSDPLEVVSMGQELKVRVIEIDLDRKRIALSCKKEESQQSRAPAKKIQKKAPPKPMNKAWEGLKNFKVKS